MSLHIVIIMDGLHERPQLPGVPRSLDGLSLTTSGPRAPSSSAESRINLDWLVWIPGTRSLWDAAELASGIGSDEGVILKYGP
jgi:hypothetical protein